MARTGRFCFTTLFTEESDQDHFIYASTSVHHHGTIQVLYFRCFASEKSGPPYSRGALHSFLAGQYFITRTKQVMLPVMLPLHQFPQFMSPSPNQYNRFLFSNKGTPLPKINHFLQRHVCWKWSNTHFRWDSKLNCISLIRWRKHRFPFPTPSKHTHLEQLNWRKEM